MTAKAVLTLHHHMPGIIDRIRSRGRDFGEIPSGRVHYGIDSLPEEHP
ncbi:MAG: hypothetical protein ACK58L_04490 [Planctomycetota bacterium]